MIHFDHIEIHVNHSLRYVEFLKKIFLSGRYKKISNNNTYMFLTSDNIRFEIKENLLFLNHFQISDGVGFCLPCLRMNGALNHLNSISSIQILRIIENPDGLCIFFKDHEGIEWHIKDYEQLDIYTNI